MPGKCCTTELLLQLLVNLFCPIQFQQAGRPVQDNVTTRRIPRVLEEPGFEVILGWGEEAAEGAGIIQ